MQWSFFVVNQKVFELQLNKDCWILFPRNLKATLHQAAIPAGRNLRNVILIVTGKAKPKITEKKPSFFRQRVVFSRGPLRQHWVTHWPRHIGLNTGNRLHCCGSVRCCKLHVVGHRKLHGVRHLLHRKVPDKNNRRCRSKLRLHHVKIDRVVGGVLIHMAAKCACCKICIPYRSVGKVNACAHLSNCTCNRGRRLGRYCSLINSRRWRRGRRGSFQSALWARTTSGGSGRIGRHEGGK